MADGWSQQGLQLAPRIPRELQLDTSDMSLQIHPTNSLQTLLLAPVYPPDDPRPTAIPLGAGWIRNTEHSCAARNAAGKVDQGTHRNAGKHFRRPNPRQSDTSGLSRDKTLQVDAAVLAQGELFSGLAAVDSWCELGQVTWSFGPVCWLTNPKWTQRISKLHHFISIENLVKLRHVINLRDERK